MPVHNAGITAIFEEIADLLEIQFERRITVDNFSQIDSTQCGVRSDKHVSITRHIISKRQLTPVRYPTVS